MHLLGNLLQKKYLDFKETDEIPIIDLLEWDLWPGILNIYGKYIYNMKYISYIMLQLQLVTIIR